MSPTGTRKSPRSRALTAALPLLAVVALVVIGAIVSVTRSSGDEPPAGNAASGQGENVTDPTLLLARDLSAQMAKPWPDAQRHDGRYKSAVGGNTRYGESLMGFALIQHGLDNDQDELVDSGLKALAYSVPRLGTQNRDSIFEALGIVGAYKRLKADMPDDPRFQKIRPKMERYLSNFEMVRLPATTYYGNHWLVESVLVQELLSSGLRSRNPHAVVGGERREAVRLARELINVRIPKMAREKNFKAGRERAFVLSDPPDDPLAYQGLSLGFYARAIQLLGKRASPAAHKTLIQVANASTWLTAPDGDLAYFGRNQEQAWALGGTVYGSEVAAGLEESSAKSEGRYRALGVRALRRLRDAHGVGRFGLNITPAVRESHKGGEKGADHGAGGPSFGALTLLFVDWSLPEIADAEHEPTQIHSESPSRALMSRGESRFAVVRTKNVWFAVRTTRGGKHPEELRDDFGLMALKLRGRNGAWKDAVRPRPITRGEGDPTDSAGPVLLRQGGLRAFPFTDKASVQRGGTVELHGGLRGSPNPFKRIVARLENGTIVRALDFSPGTLIRQNMTYRFTPTKCGVTYEFPAQAGDTVEYSIFLRKSAKPPRVTSRGVSDAGARWTFSRPASVKLEDGYASGRDPDLVRARATFSDLPNGPVRISVCGKR